MDDWRIKDYQIRCYNLQHKLTPFKVCETRLKKQMRSIRKEKKCSELCAWKILKHRLEQEVIKQARESDTFNAPFC